jgi:integrase
MTARRKAKRRSPGEGSVWAYREKNGTVRHAIGHPDLGTRRRHPVTGEKWFTQKAAQEALRELLVAAKKGELIDPSRQPTGDYLAEWADGLRLAPSTVASYRKNIRLHLAGLAAVPLSSLTTAAIDKEYRRLETSGRADHRQGEGLSPRTVRYVHTILSAALSAAVESGRLARNPAARAHPPTAKQAKSPEMHPWNADQLAAFLAWSAEHSQVHALWYVLAHTGMRRGECLTLRWRDIDLEGGTVAVRRSVGVIRNAGEGATVEEGDTKSGKPRVIDLDAATVALLRAYRKERGLMHLSLARDEALVLGDHEGGHRHPERVSRTFRAELEHCRAALGETAPPPVRLHDLRHTHATLLLLAGVPVHVVSQRLGHANATITLSVYAHVMPGSQREAADLFARLIGEA